MMARSKWSGRVPAWNCLAVPPKSRATDSTAIPGFVDVHIHGAGGHDVMEANETALSTITGRLAAFGTTSLLATTITASADDTCRSVEGIAKYISGQYQTNDARAEILGIHFEGPFLSKERRGVHPTEWLQLPFRRIVAEIFAGGSGQCADSDHRTGVVGRDAVH